MIVRKIQSFMIIDAETNKKLDESHCYFKEPITTNKELDKNRTEEVLRSAKYLESGKQTVLHCYTTRLTET